MSKSRPASLHEYNQAFLEELDRLNPEQQQAVNQLEGPVLVIAGPGTGKTHILSARIGRILLETDTQSQNILCLTFTDAGVRAMRQRLLQLIGPEAHRVHIYTFHSFCNNIIQDNLEYFGRHDLEPISELERVELIRSLLDELGPNHPLKRGRQDHFFYENHLYDLFQKMKSEDWSVEQVNASIDAYLEDLPKRQEYIYQVSRGSFKKGELKKAKYQETVERMERLRAAAQLFPRFAEAMRRARRYDYDDMILWVLRAFEQNEALLRTYQEQYLYFLVDEFQDTNGAQNEILRHLTAYWDNPNIFIVGDDDQSIYEFQGARLKNLSDFYELHKEHLQLVVLKNNYRSTQAILDSSRQLIDRNERRIIHYLRDLGIEKALVARHPQAAVSPSLPRVIVYPNRRHEEADIAEQIETLLADGTPAEEIAVIYAKHRQAQSLLTLLEKKGIPYTTRRKINVLDLPLVRNLRTLLEYIYQETQRPFQGEYLLFRILQFSFLSLPSQAVARFSRALAMLPSEGRPSWREAIADAAWLSRQQIEAAPFLAVSQWLEDLISSVENLSLPALVEQAINRSGLLRFVLDHPDQAWHLQVIKTFFDFVRAEAARRPRLRLGRLLEILQSMDANRLAIPLSKTLETEEGIRFLTAHSAKGLEFEHVFVLDVVKENWQPTSRRNNYQFAFPDTLTFSGEEDALEARRRLFYVALTRARTHLQVSFSREEQGKELQRSRFIDELPTDQSIEWSEQQAAGNTLLLAETLHLTSISKPSLEVLDPKLVAELLADFRLSISALNHFLRCPLSFYYQHVLRVPTLQSEAATYGVAMHNALERLFQQMLLSKAKQFPAEKQFLQLFEWEMERLRAYFSAREYKRRLAAGKHHLSMYYQQHLRQWHRDVRVEVNIRNTEIAGVPLTGVIDKLEFQDGQICHIIDYKTGSRDSSKLQRPGKRSIHGGSYWRQLVFYKLLYESSSRSTHRVESGTIAYLEPNSRGKFDRKTVVFKAEDIAFVEELIQLVYTRIMEQDFYEGCGESHCPWCSFLLRNEQVSDFSLEEIEALDDGK